MTMGFTGAAHTVTIGQSPRRHTLALSEGTQYDGFTLNAIGSNWEIEITRRLAGHNATTGITVAGEVSCPECFSESVTVVANLRSICPDSSLPGPAPDWKTNLLDAGEVCALLRRGANVNAQFEYRTPLHHAAGGGLIQQPFIYGDETAGKSQWDSLSSEAAKLLIARGASVNAEIPVFSFPPIDEEKTPLFLAVEQDFLKVAELLIVNGASIHVTTAFGLTLLAAARSDEMRDLLKSYLPPEPEDICRSLGGRVGGIDGGSCTFENDSFQAVLECAFEPSFLDSCEDIFNKAEECNNAGQKLQSADMCGDACMSSETAVGTRCVSVPTGPAVPAETVASLKADCEALEGTVSRRPLAALISDATQETCTGFTINPSACDIGPLDVGLSCTSPFETVKACNAENLPAVDTSICGPACPAGQKAAGGGCREFTAEESMRFETIVSLKVDCAEIGGTVTEDDTSCELEPAEDALTCAFEGPSPLALCEDVFSKAEECNSAGQKVQSADMCGDACSSSEKAVGALCVNIPTGPAVPAETIASLTAECVEAFVGFPATRLLAPLASTDKQTTCGGFAADSVTCDIGPIDVGFSCAPIFETVKACNANNQPAKNATECGDACASGAVAFGGWCAPAAVVAERSDCAALGGRVSPGRNSLCEGIVGDTFCVIQGNDFPCASIFNEVKMCNANGSPAFKYNQGGQTECLDPCSFLAPDATAVGSFCNLSAGTVVSLTAECEALGGVVEGEHCAELYSEYQSSNAINPVQEEILQNIKCHIGPLVPGTFNGDICLEGFQGIKECNSQNRPQEALYVSNLGSTESTACGEPCASGQTAVGARCAASS